MTPTQSTWYPALARTEFCYDIPEEEELQNYNAFPNYRNPETGLYFRPDTLYTKLCRIIQTPACKAALIQVVFLEYIACLLEFTDSDGRVSQRETGWMPFLHRRLVLLHDHPSREDVLAFIKSARGTDLLYRRSIFPLVGKVEVFEISERRSALTEPTLHHLSTPEGG